jgi:hypothetical protein
LYLTEEWDACRKKCKAENHSGDGVGIGRVRDGSLLGESSNKHTDDECRYYSKMGH